MALEFKIRDFEGWNSVKEEPPEVGLDGVSNCPCG